MKRKARKLTLRKETIRNLDERNLQRAAGGVYTGGHDYDTLSLGNTRCSTSGYNPPTTTAYCEHYTV